MSKPVLVGFATRYGSTQEVARAISAVLCEGSVDVDIQQVQKVKSLVPYGAVVLGMPLYIGEWHKDMQRFLSQHADSLKHVPIAIFTLGPLSTSREDIQGAHEQLDKELAKYPWLSPVTIALFGGKYNPKKLNLADQLLANLQASPLHKLPNVDLRDWAAIRTWSEDLIQVLLSEHTAPAKVVELVS